MMLTIPSGVSMKAVWLRARSICTWRLAPACLSLVVSSSARRRRFSARLRLRPPLPKFPSLLSSSSLLPSQGLPQHPRWFVIEYEAGPGFSRAQNVERGVLLGLWLYNSYMLADDSGLECSGLPFDFTKTLGSNGSVTIPYTGLDGDTRVTIVSLMSKYAL